MYFGMYYVAGGDDSYMNKDNLGVHLVFAALVAMPTIIFIGYWSYTIVIEILLILSELN